MTQNKDKIEVETAETEDEVLNAFYHRLQELYSNNELKSVFILLQDSSGGCDAFSLGELDLEDARKTLADIQSEEPHAGRTLH